jgi:hypothetical protein
MTQYPPPPPPYGYGYDPYAQPPGDPLAPAKRAGLMMFLLGGLLLLCGVCVGTFAMTVPMEQFIKESGVVLPQTPPGVSVEELMQLGYVTIGVGSLIAGGLLVLLGIFVRKGGTGAAVTSIILVSLLLLVCGIFLLASLVQMGRQPGSSAGVCVMMIPAALLLVTLITLVQAAKAGPQLAAMQQQRQFQMWQYQQQQQAYQQGGYAMPQPPPTAPPTRSEGNEDMPR